MHDEGCMLAARFHEDNSILRNPVIWGIHDFGQLCGSNAFDTYPYVEVICIRGGLLQNYQSEGKYASAAKAIASRCRSLRKLGFISRKRESDDRDVYQPDLQA